MVPAQGLAVAEAAVLAVGATVAHWLGEYEEFADDFDEDGSDEEDDQDSKGSTEDADSITGEGKVKRSSGPRIEKDVSLRGEYKRLEREIVKICAQPDHRKDGIANLREEIGQVRLSTSDRRRLHQKMLLALLESEEPSLRGYNLTDLRVRHPFPDWVTWIGGFPGLLAGIAALALAVALIWVSTSRVQNLFEVVGVPPFAVRDPRFAMFLRQAKKNGLDPAYGLDAVAEKEIFNLLFNQDSRDTYDRYGTTQVSFVSISAVLWTLSDVFIFYAVHIWVLFLACTLSRRLRGGLNSALTALGVLLFVDGRMVLHWGTPVHAYAIVNQFPVLQWLTSWEKLWMFRCVAVPLVISLCLLYASHIYEDKDEMQMQEIVDLLLNSIESERSIQRIIENCQLRREKRGAIQQQVNDARASATGERVRPTPPSVRLRGKGAAKISTENL
mmetsp:Transcript_18775/g.36784  ORF Transcript_18775/g.36784 Transcript_18775/m.36784 type:complete len:443 (+) Transcript_18775:94-1422(+)